MNNLVMQAQSDPAPVARSRRSGFVAAVTVTACCLLLGCAGSKPPPAVQNRCPPERPGCQVEVVFTDVGLGERVAVLDGRLSAGQPSASYLFSAAAGETLRMRLSGAPANLLLTSPDGKSSGPGLPAEMSLNAKGKYTLRVAAPSATPNATYGDFQLELRLIGKP